MPKSKQQKREEALIRQRQHSLLDLNQKIAICNLRRGQSKREGTRLLKQLRGAA